MFFNPFFFHHRYCISRYHLFDLVWMDAWMWYTDVYAMLILSVRKTFQIKVKSIFITTKSKYALTETFVQCMALKYGVLPKKNLYVFRISHRNICTNHPKNVFDDIIDKISEKDFLHKTRKCHHKKREKIIKMNVVPDNNRDQNENSSTSEFKAIRNIYENKETNKHSNNTNNTCNYLYTSKIHINKFDIGRKVSLCFLIVSLKFVCSILISFSHIFAIIFYFFLSGRFKTSLNKIPKLRFEYVSNNETIVNSHLCPMSFVLFGCVLYLRAVSVYLSFFHSIYVIQSLALSLSLSPNKFQCYRILSGAFVSFPFNQKKERERKK